MGEQKAAKSGIPPRALSWGTYEAERTMLTGMQARATKDFAYLNDRIVALLTDKDAMIQEQAVMKQLREFMPQRDLEQAKDEMGRWIADYFDDAGYVDWDSQCTM